MFPSRGYYLIPRSQTEPRTPRERALKTLMVLHNAALPWVKDGRVDIYLRILHQKFSKRIKPPQTDDEFKKIVHEMDKKCMCDICAPNPYRSFVNRYLLPRLDRIEDERTRGLVSAPPIHLYHKSYEVLHLVRSTVAYFNRPIELMNPLQNAAIGQIKDILARKDAKGYLQKLSARDISKELSGRDLEQIIAYFSDIFFLGGLRRVRFKWKPSLHLKGLLAYAGLYKISYDPIWHGELDEETALDRLDVLLHETVHCFLGKHAKNDWSYIINIGTGGHGRAFQILAAEIERVSSRLFGRNFDLARQDSLWSDCGRGKWSFKHLPTIHDMELYAWPVDERKEGNEEEKDA